MQSPEDVWFALADIHAKSAAHYIQRIQRSQALRQRSSELFSSSSSVAYLVQDWNKRGLAPGLNRLEPGNEPFSSHDNTQVVLHPFEAYFQASTIAQTAVDLPIYTAFGAVLGYRSATWIARKLSLPASRVPWLSVPTAAVAALSFAQWRAKRGITHLINTSLLFPESPLSNASRDVVSRIPLQKETAKADRYYRRFFAAAIAFAETSGGGVGEGFDMGIEEGFGVGLGPRGLEAEDVDLRQPDMWEPEPEEARDDGNGVGGVPERTFEQGKSWEDIRRER